MASLRLQLGVLGGGQLSMMLAQRAQALGFPPAILTPNPLMDPAGRVSARVQPGDPKDSSHLENFAQSVDLLTFESEFYDADYLKIHLQKSKAFIFPSLQCLDLLQDRKTQKESFLKNKLNTSPFICTDQSQEIQSFFKIHGALVAKKRWNGYDGYGTFILKTEKELHTFLEDNIENLKDFIFEKKIAFQFEMAVQVARSRKGHVVFFPFVKTTQKDNKCFLVEGPEKPPQPLQKAIQKYLNKINYVGVIGFEFFKTASSLILNEVAPRVHNTGHHSLDSCDVDQFTMHWLCALQDKLPTPKLKTKAFVMLNLIGQSEAAIDLPDRREGTLYWYGKSNRKGRKLGHVNFTGENKKALVTKAFQELKHWKL